MCPDSQTHRATWVIAIVLTGQSVAACNLLLGNERVAVRSSSAQQEEDSSAKDGATTPPVDDAGPASDDGGSRPIDAGMDAAPPMAQPMLDAGADAAMPTNPTMRDAGIERDAGAACTGPECCDAAADCSSGTAVLQCVESRCKFTGCRDGRADCRGPSSEDCETQLGTITDCTGCGATCPAAQPLCQPARSAGGYECVDPAAGLRGAALSLQCGTLLDNDHLCWSDPPGTTSCLALGYGFDKHYTFGGQESDLFVVTLAVRGIVEPKQYTGGTKINDHFMAGGEPAPDTLNTYRMTISSPRQIYHFNHEDMPSGVHVFQIDYRVQVMVTGGAMITLSSYDSDCQMFRNCSSPDSPCVPVAAPNGTSLSTPADQFVELTVEEVTLSKQSPPP